MASNFSRKTSKDHFLEVTPRKQSAKVGRQLFVQVWDNLDKNHLHPQKCACCYTYGRSNTLGKRLLFEIYVVVACFIQFKPEQKFL